MKVGDSSEIKVGDVFLDFRAYGEVYETGSVDEITSNEVMVDFSDYRASYARHHVSLFEENRGFIWEFYSSRTPGQVIERFD